MSIARLASSLSLTGLLLACGTTPDATKVRADSDATSRQPDAGQSAKPAEPTAACENGPIKPAPNAQLGRYRVRGYTADRARVHFFLEAKGAGQNTVEVQAASPALADLLLRSEGTQQTLELGIAERDGCVGEVVFVRSQ